MSLIPLSPSAGPPGVGNSLALWIYVLHAVKTGSIALILSLPRTDAESPRAMLIDNNPEHNVRGWTDLRDADVFLQQLKRHNDPSLVLIDGANKLSLSISFLNAVGPHFRDKCRVIITTSNGGAIPKLQGRSRALYKLVLWTKDDVRNAFHAIWQQGSPPLVFARDVDLKQELCDASTDLVHANIDAVFETKFYYSGWSARFFFSRPICEIIASIREAIDRLPSIGNPVGAGDSSLLAVNTLVAEGKVVSGRAASDLCRASDAVFDFIKTILGTDSNPAIDGWVLEVWYLRQLRTGDHKLDLHGKQTESETGVRMYDDKDLSFVAEVLEVGNAKDLQPITRNIRFWFIPNLWCQGGFDFVHIDVVDGLARVAFFQVTRATKHSRKTKYFLQVLACICGYDFNEGAAQVFVIDGEGKRDGTVIPNGKSCITKVSICLIGLVPREDKEYKLEFAQAGLSLPCPVFVMNTLR